MQTKEIITVNDFIASLRVMEHQSHKKLSIHYLRSDLAADLGILSFGDAMTKGFLSVTEVGDGDVPSLKFTNSSQCRILISEGSVIEGLKQSRAVRSTFVLDSMEERVIPVHCVEIGRFGYEHDSSKTKYSLSSRLRAMNLRYSNESLRKAADIRNSSSQSETWRNIQKMRERKERQRNKTITSPTGSYGDIYQEEKKTVDQYLKSFVCPETASGFIAMLNGEVLGLECFGNSALLKANHETLLAGTVMDLDQEIKQSNIMTPEHFLKNLIASAKEQHPAIGQGQDIRFEESSFVGSCLVADDAVLHLEAFAL